MNLKATTRDTKRTKCRKVYPDNTLFFISRSPVQKRAISVKVKDGKDRTPHKDR